MSLSKANVVFILFLVTKCSYGNDIISVAPVDTVGCYGGVSKFYCESDRSDVNLTGWQINGDSITNTATQLRGISVHTNGVGNSTITIIGSDFNNGISIGCVVITSGPPYFDTNTALFTVSDIPPVTNLTITFTNNGTIMNCTWIQPSCLPVNYWYSISINNVTVTNTTSTIYSTSNIESCTNYTVSVTITDGQYQSIPVIEKATSEYFKDLKVDLYWSAYFNDTTNRFIEIEFHVVSLKYRNSLHQLFCNCKADIVDKIISSKYSDILNSTIDDLLKSYNKSTGIGYYTIGPFNESFRGKYILQTQDEEEIALTEISTFNVQDAHISQTSNGSTMMECVFAYNSPADGCQFELLTTRNVTSRNITKDKNEDTATLYTDLDIPKGEYDVRVYDIVNHAIDYSLAYELSYTHKLISTVISSSTSYTGTMISSTSTSVASSPTNTMTTSALSSFVMAIIIGVVIAILLLIVTLISLMVFCKVKQISRKKFQLILNAGTVCTTLLVILVCKLFQYNNYNQHHQLNHLPQHLKCKFLTKNVFFSNNYYMPYPVVSKDNLSTQHNYPVTLLSLTQHNENKIDEASSDNQDYMEDRNNLCDDSTIIVEFVFQPVVNTLSQTQSPPYHDVPSSTECEHYVENTTHSPTHTDPVSQSHDTLSLPLYVAKSDMDYKHDQDMKESLVNHCHQYALGANDSESDLIPSPSNSIVNTLNNKPSSRDRILNSQYAKLDLNNLSSSTTTVNDSSDNTHHPIPRANESKHVYATTVDPTTKVYTEQCGGYPVYDVNTGVREPNEQNPIIVDGEGVGSVSPSEDSDGFTLVHGVTQQNNGLEDNELCVCNGIMVACQEESHGPSPDRHAASESIIMEESFPLPYFNDYSMMSISDNYKQNDDTQSEISDLYETCQSLHEKTSYSMSPMVMRSNWTVPSHEDMRLNLAVNSETESHQIIEETEIKEEVTIIEDLIHRENKPSSVISDPDTIQKFWELIVADFSCSFLKLIFGGDHMYNIIMHTKINPRVQWVEGYVCFSIISEDT